MSHPNPTYPTPLTFEQNIFPIPMISALPTVLTTMYNVKRPYQGLCKSFTVCLPTTYSLPNKRQLQTFDNHTWTRSSSREPECRRPLAHRSIMPPTTHRLRWSLLHQRHLVLGCRSRRIGIWHRPTELYCRQHRRTSNVWRGRKGETRVRDDDGRAWQFRPYKWNEPRKLFH